MPSVFANPLLGAVIQALPGLLSPGVRTAPRPSLGRITSTSRLTELIGDPIRQPIGDPLTPLTPSQQPGLGFQPGSITVASPDADPCAVRVREKRRAQRERRKKCKRFTTKEIRVCAERS